MMSHFTASSKTDYSVSPGFVQPLLEDRLHGLSADELKKLHELVTFRLAHQPSVRMANSIRSTEETNLQRLTNRENEVLTLVASGYTRPEVAESLKISRNTAAKHVTNIYRKLEIESIAEATMVAFRCGVVS